MKVEEDYYCDRCGRKVVDCLLEFKVPARAKVHLCAKCESELDRWLRARRTGRYELGQEK